MLILFVRFLHIASAMLFIGGILARQIVRAYAKRTDDVRRFATLSEAAGRVENTMVIPGNMAVILCGVILGLLIKAPILGFLQGAPRNWLREVDDAAWKTVLEERFAGHSRRSKEENIKELES